MSDFVLVRWEGNNSRKYDGSTNKVDKKYIIHGQVEIGKCVTIQYGKGKKTWKAKIVTGDSDSDCDSDGSLEVPLFNKRTCEDAGITPTRRGAKNKCIQYDRALKPRSFNKVSEFLCYLNCHG